LCVDAYKYVTLLSYLIRKTICRKRIRGCSGTCGFHTKKVGAQAYTVHVSVQRQRAGFYSSSASSPGSSHFTTSRLALFSCTVELKFRRLKCGFWRAQTRPFVLFANCFTRYNASRLVATNYASTLARIQKG
jgi:hypothetical protein